MIDVLIYLLCFIIYVIIQSWVINGLKACTEGSWEVMPDGKRIAKGMIFFRIAQYFNKYDSIPIYYRGEGIRDLIESCREKFGNSIPVSFLSGKVNDNVLTIEDDGKDALMINQFMDKILKKNENVVCAKLSENEYVFYKEYERHRFPKFIRKSMALSCIKCASSFWGTVTYIPAVIYFGVTGWILAGWLASMLILSYLNYYIYKRV